MIFDGNWLKFLESRHGVELSVCRSVSLNEPPIFPQMGPMISGSFTERDDNEEEGNMEFSDNAVHSCSCDTEQGSCDKM